MMLVREIADYRMARQAIDAMNNPDKKIGFELLSKNEGLQKALRYMVRAQSGKPLEEQMITEETAANEALEIAQAYRNKETDEDDGDSSRTLDTAEG